LWLLGAEVGLAWEAIDMMLKGLTWAREAVLGLAIWLPRDRRVRLDRRLRAVIERREMKSADCIVVSYGNSGRTWLRVMLSAAFCSKYGLRRLRVIEHDNLHRKQGSIPHVMFTHDNYIADLEPPADPKALYRSGRVVLLVRDPADVAVSQFYQWRYRMRKWKKVLNRYPEEAELSLFEFVMDRRSGLPRIIAFMNSWAAAFDSLRCLKVVRYEDLRADPVGTLGGILEFIGTSMDEEHVRRAVDLSSLSAMRRLEDEGNPLLRSYRRLRRERAGESSYKARRGKVGGYRDDFSSGQLEEIDRLVAATLSTAFGYVRSP
jgi:hypothetical protein